MNDTFEYPINSKKRITTTYDQNGVWTATLCLSDGQNWINYLQRRASSEQEAIEEVCYAYAQDSSDLHEPGHLIDGLKGGTPWDWGPEPWR